MAVACGCCLNRQRGGGDGAGDHDMPAQSGSPESFEDQLTQFHASVRSLNSQVAVFQHRS